MKIKLNVILNGLIHVLILFIILSILYFNVIMPLEKKAFEKEIASNIDKGLKQSLKDFEDIDDGVKTTLENFFENEGYNRLISKYDKPSKEIEEHNMWVRRTCIAFIVFVSLLLLGIMGYIWFGTCKDLELKHLLSENIISFIFVGLFELFFFTTVAFKFVPAPPSLLINTLYDTFKKDI